MKIKLPVVVLLAMIVPGPARAAALSTAEATFLDHSSLPPRCSNNDAPATRSMVPARFNSAPDFSAALMPRWR